MLDRSKLLRGLQGISDKLFIDNSQNYAFAHQLWQKISKDSLFIHKVKAAQGSSPWLVPTWQGDLAESKLMQHQLDNYRVLAIDGSQVYPDRHQGTPCFLINIGSVFFTYSDSKMQSSVKLDTNPTVYIEHGPESESATEMVNCRRQELEFLAGVHDTAKFKPGSDSPFLFLFDGSLIFWHLEAKDPATKQDYIARYMAALFQLYQSRTLFAGYISMPKNKELVNLLRMELCDFKFDKEVPCKDLDMVVDTSIAYFYFELYERSNIFKNHANICAYYPEYLHPHFFYINVGTEIGRVEIPAWIAQDEEKVDLIATIIIDQSIKGRGYPVAIAEAHEQAVVKGPDREFFYQLIYKIGFDRNQRFSMSQKSVKKRGIGI